MAYPQLLLAAAIIGVGVAVYQFLATSNRPTASNRQQRHTSNRNEFDSYTDPEYIKELLNQKQRRKKPDLDRNCTICFEPCNINTNPTRVLPICGHKFHRRCINKWLQESKTCPNCRKPCF